MTWQAKIIQKKESGQAEQELKILEADVAAARDFLCTNHDNYFSGKKQIPIYLLLGPSGFGKTTILAQAGLNLKNFNNQTLNNVTPTKYCSFWFSQDAIYIDIAGTYTKPEIAKPRNDLIWQGFIKLLQKYFGKNAISGALIILDLPAITQDIDLLKKTLFCVRERIYELVISIKSLPMYIIFTKCDRIAGFTEFFSLLDVEERSQPFGIAFTDNQERNNPVPMFEIKFNELLKHLNARVIERLQKSTYPDERLLIKSFPSQLGCLNKILLKILGDIPSGEHLSLLGIYFTSSIQSDVAIDIIKNSLLHAFNFKEKQAHKLETNNKCSYFIKDIFKKIITTSTTKQPKRFHQFYNIKFQFNYIYILLVMLLIVGIGSYIGYKSYHKNITAIHDIEYLLQNQEITSNPDIAHDAISKIDLDAQSLWLKLGINETKPLLHALHHIYQISFLQKLESQLENNLSAIITSPNFNSDPRKLYDAIQAYLMLGNPKKLDKTYIKTWFNNYWSVIYEDDIAKRNKLKRRLEQTLEYPFQIKLNQQTLAVVRKHLNSLSLAPLIYLIFENTYSNQNINVGSIKPISKIYTKEYFNKTYNKTIPEIINNLPKHDWVLGNNLRLKIRAAADNNVIQNIRALYLEKYINTWETVANNPKIKINTKNLSTTTEDLKTFASNNSSFIKLLEQIKINTNIKNAPISFSNAISIKLQEYNKINLADLQRELEILANSFDAIAKNSDPSLMAFNAVIHHLKNEQPDFLNNLQIFANNQPLPVQAWIQSIIKNTWPVLLDAASDHINKAWQTKIVPEYQKMLANKYPLFKDSKEEISFVDFNKFFAPQGLIDSFFGEYIKPFVNFDKTSWTWKDIDGYRINFSHNSLEVFLRAALIQKMFYSQKTQQPLVQFTLAPMDISPNTQGFTMHIEGQKVVFTDKDKKSYDLVWPGPNPGLVTMDFINSQGRYFNNSTFGPWAWFRLIAKSNLSQANSTRHFIITFDLNGNAARYELSAAEPINPFIPEIINNFRCPDQLYD